MQESFIVGSAVALIATVLGWFLNRNSARKAVDLAFEKATDLLINQEFIKAGIQFREEFLDTIEKLESRTVTQEPGKQNFAIDFIEGAYPKQRKTYFRFREFLPESTRAAFEAAWNEYICKRPDDHDYEFLFLDYHDKRYSDTLLENELKIRDEALKRIKKLTDFTK